MRLQKLALTTTRETPAEAEIVSHQLMLRAGMIRRLSAGLYTWTPIGMRVLRRVEAVVRSEMDAAGALEILMPAVQPADLWHESGRWDEMGGLMLRIRDRAERDYCFGPTHEEVVVDFVKRDLESYRQLPVNYYQIQTKFRDEIRPRFGLMRAREFVMKDAYSFHIDDASLDHEYHNMAATYRRILDQLALDYRVVAADSGAIGGSKSEEFHILADSGEDELAVASAGGYAANVETADVAPPTTPRPAPVAALQQVNTPNVATIADLCRALNVPAENTVKAIVVDGTDGDPVLLTLRGDHNLNELKAERHPAVATPLAFASRDTIQTAFGAAAGSLGPVGFEGTVIADQSVAASADLVVGANIDGAHLTGFNWARDADEPLVADLRNVVAGDTAPDATGEINIMRGIEVGHVFQLGDKYSRALNLSVPDADGNNVHPPMGCYGIGVSRLVAAAIEQCHDNAGICWPAAMAPFELVICPIGADRDPAVAEAAENLYQTCLTDGIDVALDDRGLRPGPMFADTELIGVPHRVVVSARGLAAGTLEYKNRQGTEADDITFDIDAVRARIRG
ncbi:proline--tRNA ligase [Salinisphaera sp. USBA-960]|uniref:proline--tRNA ligase n=1 Tax=Salinisphaera orenii TaxID=856731 RepID=UPI000DBE3447|nr:proline--tRNA ligase [Salifodinibacter halophilus]NNC25454.1 proline--tRNA ligase [Salifodinibacter halophilus]